MIAEQARLTQLLEGSKQFEVPLYQRPYSWETSDREQFWQDILRVGRGVHAGLHFTGSVVYMERTGSMGGTLKRARLIDGQQRLTTLTLLMLAVAERLTQDGALELTVGKDTQLIDAGDIRDDYLLNKKFTGDSAYKLLSTQRDRATLKALLAGDPPPERASREVQAGAAFFRQKLADPGVDLRDVLRGVHRLQVVTVALEEGKDDPQLIFESLNSTGKDLTQADLIRNNVLMGLDPEHQDDLSSTYWVPMEQRFAETEAGTFDRFMRDFLTLRTRIIPNERDVYSAFKAYRGSRPTGEGVKTLVSDVAGMARLYMGFLHPESLPTPALQRAMEDLIALRVRVISPFVLELLEDHAAQRLTDSDLVQALRLLESFLLRRAVVGERTAPLNRLFATLGRDVQKADPLTSLQAALIRFQDRNRDGFPTDEVFAEALGRTALYGQNVCKPLLVRLERSLNPRETFDTDTLTIEHVLPQNANLSEPWRVMLGEDWATEQERLVHTLGNLTLTGYNSELGDRPFGEKKTLPPPAHEVPGAPLTPRGYVFSRILMTQDIARRAQWTPQEIRERGAELTARALTLWPFPALNAAEVAALRADGRQRGGARTVEDHLETSSPELRTLFGAVRGRLLKLDSVVTESPQKTYVAYKAPSNFCDMVPQPALNTVKCWLNLPPDELDDPLHLTRDVTGKGKSGNGNVEMTITLQTDLDAFESLARQALAYQLHRQSLEAAEKGIPVDTLPPGLRPVMEALVTRLKALSPTVHARHNQGYMSYREQQAFCEFEALADSLGLRARVGPQGDGIPEADRAHWSTTRWPGWWRRKLASLDDLEAAWPGIQQAYVYQTTDEASGAAYSSPSVVRSVQGQLIQAALKFGTDVRTITAGRTTFLQRSGQEFARLRKNETDGFVSIQGRLPVSGKERVFLHGPDDVPKGLAMLEALYAAPQQDGDALPEDA